MWARIMRERFGAKNPKSQMLRFHTQTGGSTLTAQQPENNIVRVAMQALAAVCGGTQSLHTNGFDEALALPTERRRARAAHAADHRHESGATDTVDPFAGSYFVEALTDELEARARELIERVDELGGAVARSIQARVGKVLIAPAMVLAFAAGIYLASDRDLFGETWVVVPMVILIVLFGMGGAFFGPTEERAAQAAARDVEAAGDGPVTFSPQYEALAARIANGGKLATVLIVVAIYFMVAKPFA
jgi:uncharacterized membrane protein